MVKSGKRDGLAILVKKRHVAKHLPGKSDIIAKQWKEIEFPSKLSAYCPVENNKGGNKTFHNITR